MRLLRAISAYFLAAIGGLVALRLLPQDAAAAAGFKSTRPVYSFTATVDPANHLAASAVNTTVTVPAGCELLATDLIVPIPPVTLEAAIDVKCCVYASATTMTLRTGNASAGAVDPASATWTFLVFRS